VAVFIARIIPFSGGVVMRVPTVVAALLGVALLGCASDNPDKVKPDLPRVTVEVTGMT
jgi:hypothetical protein